MKLGARQRWLVLIALLTLALSAAAWVRDTDQSANADIVEAPTRHTRTVAAAPEQPATPADRVRLEKMRTRAGTGQGEDAFAPHSWRKLPKTPAPVAAPVIVTPPQQQVAAPPPPPKPTAPPLPFGYMGKISSEEANAIFLTMGERNLIVHEGDVIDALYRLEKISSADLTFTHLPTGIEQHLPIGGSQ